MNLFDFDSSLTDSHFHLLRILKYLIERNNKKSKIGRGYVEINELVMTAEDISIRREVIYDSIVRLSSSNLIELDNQSQSDVNTASFLKITPAGTYYLTDLIFEFVYLDSVIIDTPISDDSLFNHIKYSLNATELSTRVERTRRFVKYLVLAETDEFEDRPQYLHSELTNYYFAKNIAIKFDMFESQLRNAGIL